jgi:hypothetical protein
MVADGLDAKAVAVRSAGGFRHAFVLHKNRGSPTPTKYRGASGALRETFSYRARDMTAVMVSTKPSWMPRLTASSRVCTSIFATMLRT